ncbi:MAG: response regulator transcription factor [Segetibacter sp.]|jgi:DNA-binding NarL/FixJ family response regulator|nr:response regulator transcription factor [Segetibacter sp.]
METNKCCYDFCLERIGDFKVGNLKKQRMKILIVDDSPLIIARIIELINNVKGVFAIKTCGTFTDAIQLLQEFQPNVILSDISLPDKSGIELLRYTKNNFPLAIVIMVSNETSHYASLCLQMGAHYYVDKSKEFDKIPGIISSVT